jgi:AraC-like DNA-binding protein
MEANINEIIDYYARACIRFAGMFFEYREPNSRGIGRRTHPFCGGLAIPLTGNICFSLNGTKYMIRPGAVVHAGPGMRISIEGADDKAWRLAVIHYYISGNETDSFPLFQNHFSFTAGESAKIPDLIHQLLLSQSTPGPAALFRTKLLFTSLLGELFDSAKRRAAGSDSILAEQVMEYIRQNHTEPITVAQTAEHFGLDRRRLAALFERCAGMSPGKYLIDCRILKAKELLRTCDCTVKQVAECVGYSDNLYFSKAFKKKIGASPSEFRARVKRGV